jgi:hypothetical protein
MLLLINAKKIEEELKNTSPGYAVSIAYHEPETQGYTEVPTAEAHSAVNVLPPDVEAARERLMALRRKVVEKGGLVASGEALARIIDETRGR